MFQCQPCLKLPSSLRGASRGVPANQVLPLTPFRMGAGGAGGGASDVDVSVEEEVLAAPTAAASRTGFRGYTSVPSEGCEEGAVPGSQGGA